MTLAWSSLFYYSTTTIFFSACAPLITACNHTAWTHTSCVWTCYYIATFCYTIVFSSSTYNLWTTSLYTKNFQFITKTRFIKYFSSYGILVAVAHVERVDAAQVRKRAVRDGMLVAVAHVERFNAVQVLKRVVRNGSLEAGDHVKRVDAFQVLKCSVRNGQLVAAAHVERVNAAQVLERGVIDGHLAAAIHV